MWPSEKKADHMNVLLKKVDEAEAELNAFLNGTPYVSEVDLNGYKFHRNAPNVTLSFPFDTPIDNTRVILLPDLIASKTVWMRHTTYGQQHPPAVGVWHTTDERIQDTSVTQSYKSPKFKIMTSSLRIKIRIVDVNRFLFFDIIEHIRARANERDRAIVHEDVKRGIIEFKIDCVFSKKIKDSLSKTFDEKIKAQSTFHQHKDEILQMEEIFDSKVAVLKEWFKDITPENPDA